MNCVGVSILVNLLIFSIVCVHLTSSASFPNPPQKPAPNASPEEYALFWKLLHNYYAIIGRPRFGKRSGSLLPFPNHRSFVEFAEQDSMPSVSSEETMDRMLTANVLNGVNQPLSMADFYTLENSERRRRRR